MVVETDRLQRQTYLNVTSDAKLSRNAIDSMLSKRPKFIGKGKSKQLATYTDKKGVEKPIASRTRRTP